MLTHECAAGLRDFAVKFGFFFECRTEITRQRIHPPEAGIVARVLVFATGITEADDELDGAIDRERPLPAPPSPVKTGEGRDGGIAATGIAPIPTFPRRRGKEPAG